MAIVKILKSSRTFLGVSYNETRVKNGEATLLEASNFNPLCDQAKDYINELRRWSERNTRVKNPQLHVVISLKGKIEDEKELLVIGKEWLRKMGYIDNPYLIYIHNNTKNSHIHIVTSRIDKNGNKIDHNFERVRSNKILNEITGINLSKETRSQIYSLLRYSFSTNRQFLELCRDNGYNIKEESDNIILSKGGVEVGLSNDLIEFCSRRYYKEIDSKRKKQLQAYIFKYAKLLNRDDFVDVMRKRFGLSFKLYGKDGHLYGFSIIDYKNQSIYKGSELFGIKKMNELLFADKNPSEKYNLLLSDFLSSHKFANISDVNEMLSEYGVGTDGYAFYNIVNSDNLGDLSEKLINRLKYNSQLQNIVSTFSPESKLEYRYLSRIYNIRYKDLKDCSVDRMPRNIDYYKSLINDIIDTHANIEESLAEFGIQFIRTKDDYLIVDLNNKAVLSGQSIGISRDDINDNIGYTEVVDDRGYFYQDDDLGDENEYSYPSETSFDVLIDLLSVNAASGGRTSSRKRKNR